MGVVRDSVRERGEGARGEERGGGTKNQQQQQQILKVCKNTNMRDAVVCVWHSV